MNEETIVASEALIVISDTESATLTELVDGWRNWQKLKQIGKKLSKVKHNNEGGKHELTAYGRKGTMK